MPRILVVDDDRSVQEMLADTLRGAGYEVDTCRDGNEVLPVLGRGEIDFVVLDVLIPHKNGFTVLEEARGLPDLRELPILLMSGIYRGRNHRDDTMKRFGVVDYLDKPVHIERLLSLVKDAVGPGTAPPPITLDNPRTPIPLTHLKSESVPQRRIADEDSDPRLIEPEALSEQQEVEAASRQRFRTSAFLLQGSIKRNPVAALLGRIWHDRSSGGLLLRRQRVKKIVYIREGHAYGVKSNLVSECLGQLLVRERLISTEECAASVEAMKTSGRRQGEILVEMRSMTEKNLRFALELQLEKKLFETFYWEDGEFRFNPSLNLPRAGPELEWKGAGVVVEGIRRAFDETRLRGLMLPILEVPLSFRSTDYEWEALGFSKRERRAIVGWPLPATARALLDHGALPPSETLAVLYTLIALNIVVP